MPNDFSPVEAITDSDTAIRQQPERGGGRVGPAPADDHFCLLVIEIICQKVPKTFHKSPLTTIGVA